MPSDFIDIALQGPHLEPLLDYVRERAERDPREIRRRALANIEAVREMMDRALAALGDADKLERTRPLKIERDKARRRQAR